MFCRIADFVGRPLLPITLQLEIGFLKISFPYGKEYPFNRGSASHTMKLARFSQENLALSQAELESVLHVAGTRDKELYLFEGGSSPHLALTKELFEVSTVDEVTGSFLVRSHTNTEVEEIAKLLWDSYVSRGLAPIVDLTSPDTEIHLFSFQGKELLCKLLWRNTEKFGLRRSHLLPAPHPSSLAPKLARAMINLAQGQKLLDPFCGSGGILIEGALLGKEMTGSDIDRIQLKRAQKNLDHFGLVAELREADATLVDDPVDAIVTDLPFGKNTKLENRDGTFRAFLDAAARITNRMIIGTDEELPPSSWEIEQVFTWYLHRSLEKKIYVLRSSASS